MWGLAKAMAAFPRRAAVLPVTGVPPRLDPADWGEAGPRLSAALSATTKDRPGPVLALRRNDAATGGNVLFCFSRSEREQIHVAELGDCVVTVRLCPGGAAVVLIQDSVLTGFLVKAVNEVTGASTNVCLSADNDRVCLDIHADAVGRRTSAGWEMTLLYPSAPSWRGQTR
jgi:hypothetical protein